MKTFVASALLASLALADSVDMKFMQYVTEHGKSYGTVEEFEFRKNLFAKADAEIEAHAETNATFELGHNEFSDWTATEFHKMLGYIPEALNAEEEEFDVLDAPASVNWVQQGAVNPIKNQGKCGSCWAFSAIGAVEGRWKIAHGQLYSLSEQQLVNCVPLCHGCNGGSMALAFAYLRLRPALTENDYPYKAADGKCDYDSSKATKVKTSGLGYGNVKQNSPADLKGAIAQGPVSVAIQADTRVFQSYSRGVFDSAACGTALNHGVLAVGYGSENGREYYIVRNSWGPNWGENGYVRLAVQDGAGVCGVQAQPVFPKI